MRRVRQTIVAVEKQYVLYILCGVSVILVVQHAKGTRRIILSSVACPAVPYFFRIISQMVRFFEGKTIVFEKKKVF